MSLEEKPCAIWGTPAKAWKDFNFKGEVFDSPRAGGKYRLSTYVTGPTFENMIDADKARLTNWIVNQHREGVEEPVVTMRVIDNISNSKVLNLSAVSNLKRNTQSANGCFHETVFQTH